MMKGKSGNAIYLIEVIPIAKIAPNTSISYFSGRKVAPGTLVKVPLRSGISIAVAVKSKDVRIAKGSLKSAAYSLKKIKKSDILDASLPIELIESAEKVADYYAAPTGSVLYALLPKVVVDEANKFFKNPEIRKKKADALHSFETILLQMETEERFGQYRAQVRQAFARNRSVIFVVPTHLDALRAQSELSKGIVEFVYAFNPEKKPEAKRIWAKALDEPHPILFITLPAGLAFPRKDVDTIILERENSRAYRTLERPYIHWKFFAEIFAKLSGRRLLLGDAVLSIETLWKEKRGIYGESSLIRWRLPGAPTKLVDASGAQNKSGHFEILSPELKSLITQALAENDRIFLFGARKGLSPTTVCGDCGMVLSCLNCGAPVVLHKKDNATTVYVCHACRSMRDSATTCDYCDSWKLLPLGIGTEQIAKAVKELFPHRSIWILDKDHAKSEARAKSIVKAFRENGSILVGTELALLYLDSVPYSGLVSADSLFSIPDFGINERIFYLVSRLREITAKAALIQTRNIGEQVLSWAALGNIIDFYLNEIAEREELLYPPFSIFIKITVPEKHRDSELNRLKIEFEKWQPDSIKDSLVIRIPFKLWPDQELTKKLSLLGPQFLIKVDPESIL